MISALKIVFSSVVLGISTLLLVLCMVPVALVKLLLRTPSVRSRCDRALMSIAALWIDINTFWMKAVNTGALTVTGIDGLNPQGWYLVASNHQTWVDIIVLQRVFNRRIPMLKFFTKKELLYVPVIGFAWWALDFPFMQRKGGKSAKADLEAGRKACAKFRLVPTSVISFVEGTRFTAAKHAQQQSPYRHLLKPKVGGIGMALETLGDAFTGFLDVTLAYPDGPPTFPDAMAGRMGDVVVHVHQRQIPPEVLPPPGDPAPRAPVQAWVSSLWQKKDHEIEALLTGQKPTLDSAS